MKKFMLDAKSTLGLAPKTVDEEYEKKAAAVRSVDSNLRAYGSAASRMTSAVHNLTSAMETMATAFEDMAKTEGCPDAAKKVATEYSAGVKKLKDEYEADFKKSMSEESDLKKQLEECTKLSNERGKVMADYDTYREAVTKKEEEYKKKNKDLSQSKNYNEEVKKRDEFKAKYEELNSEYKAKADAIIEANSAFVSKCMQDYLTSAATLITAMQKDLHTMQESAKSLKA